MVPTKAAPRTWGAACPAPRARLARWTSRPCAPQGQPRSQLRAREPLIIQQTCQGSFPAVSKPILQVHFHFALFQVIFNDYFRSILQDLQHLHILTMFPNLAEEISDREPLDLGSFPSEVSQLAPLGARPDSRAGAADTVPRLPEPELKGSIGEGPNHSNHSHHSNSFKIGIFLRKFKNFNIF